METPDVIFMNEQLQQLVIAVQQQPRGTGERQKVVAQLVEQMLCSRKICRSPQGQTLAGIYGDIFQEIQQQLKDEVEGKIDNYNSESLGIRQWVTEIRGRVFQQVLDETCLQQLALVAQQYAPKTQERQYAVEELVNALCLSGKLRRQGNIPDHIYREAVNQTLFYLCRKIDKYQPDKGRFLGWVNYRLERILRKTYRLEKEELAQSLKAKIIHIKYQLSSLVRKTKLEDVQLWLKLKLKGLIPEVSWWMDIGLILAALATLSQLMVRETIVADALLFEMAKASLPVSEILAEHQQEEIEENFLANIPAPEVEVTLLDKVRQYIADDPKRLCQKHIREHPEATFQEIALRRLGGESWKQISAALGIGIPTLSNFFQRRLKALVPEIRSYIEEYFD
ncbi:MAG: hypothetical protein F6K41_30165 [Symploca sp. SIO3E6]|nr:hypothetical protein [Caldora sp. SIO3E6]